MTPIAGALFEACAEQRLAHVSASSDAAVALQMANALLQQVPSCCHLPSMSCSTTPVKPLFHKHPTATFNVMCVLSTSGHMPDNTKTSEDALIGMPTSAALAQHRSSLKYSLTKASFTCRLRKAVGGHWSRHTCCPLS